jgi:hypothetical protein
MYAPAQASNKTANNREKRKEIDKYAKTKKVDQQIITLIGKRYGYQELGNLDDI